jgi:hypothetical protein
MKKTLVRYVSKNWFNFLFDNIHYLSTFGDKLSIKIRITYDDKKDEITIRSVKK